MATLVLDTVQNSSLLLEGQSGGRLVRTGIVKDLPTTGIDKSAILYYATTADGMPARGSPHPTVPGFFLTSVGVFGESIDVAGVELLYEPFSSSIGTSYVIEVASSSQTYESNMLPGTKQPIQVAFTPTDTTKYRSIPAGLVTMTMERTLSRIIVTQLRVGTLSVAATTAFAANHNLVNASTWLGYPSGAWRVTFAGATVSRYDGYYVTRLEATRQGSDLWVYFGLLQNDETGKVAYEPGKTEIEISSIRNLPYAYGISVGNGVVRCDPFNTTNFTTLFGF